MSPVFAQEEELLIEEESAATTEDDLFSGDFFSDLDSFLEESSDETNANDAVEPTAEDSLIEPVSNNQVEESAEESLQSSASGSSQGLPSSAQVTLTVTNVSQDNANATQSGARPGDVLRYEITLNSQTDDVVNYVPSVNVSGIEKVVEFTNTGFGVRESGSIVYPAYSNQAPCTQAFTFFVRVLDDCADLTALSVSTPQAGSVSVPLNCGLAQTGPSQSLFLLAGLMMLVLTLIFGVFSRKTSR